MDVPRGSTTGPYRSRRSYRRVLSRRDRASSRGIQRRQEEWIETAVEFSASPAARWRVIKSRCPRGGIRGLTTSASQMLSRRDDADVRDVASRCARPCRAGISVDVSRVCASIMRDACVYSARDLDRLIERFPERSVIRVDKREFFSTELQRALRSVRVKYLRFFRDDLTKGNLT